MKLSVLALLALFGARADAFGVHKPVYGAVQNGGASLHMRVGTFDFKRKQTLKSKLSKCRGNVDLVKEELLSENTSALVKKCNWKLRKAMMRKITNTAGAVGVEVDPSFGVPPTPAERVAAEMALKSQNDAKKDEEYQAYLKGEEERLAKKAEVKAAKPKLLEEMAKIIAEKKAAHAASKVEAAEPVVEGAEEENPEPAIDEPAPVEA